FSASPAESTDDGTRFNAPGWISGAVTLGMGDTSGDASLKIVAVRFPNITIPQGATINSASISFISSFTTTDVIDTIIYGIDEDNTTTFSSDPTGRTKTTASNTWTVSGSTAEQTHTTSSITTIVQEIVDRGGWVSGNAMGFLIQNNGTTGDKSINLYAFDNGSKEAVLNVNYETAESKTVIFRGRSRYITPREDVTIE
ncbi:hypothetical protein LCGC14_2985200, partial [marine sediment metagenome]